MVFRCHLQELNGVGVTVQHLQAQWITEQGQVQDQMEEPVNMVIRPREQALPRALGLQRTYAIHLPGPSHGPCR
jgi:hypothetical protein